MKIAIRHFINRKKPCLVIEQGNQSIILATFTNTDTEKILVEALNGKNALFIVDDRSLDEIISKAESEGAE